MKEVIEQIQQLGARLGQRLDQVERRFDQVDGRLGRVEGQLQKQGVLLEAVSADVKMALEGIAGNRQVMDQAFDEMAEKLDQRVQPIEQASRHFARALAPSAAKPPRRKKRA